MKFHILFISIFFLLSIAGITQYLPQDSIVRVSGRVLDQEKGSPIPYVSVFNKRTVRGTMTDSSGYFSIIINRYDTLYFSSLGYKPAKLTVPEDIRSNLYFFNLSLDTRTFVLKTVHVYGLTKKQQFKKDFIDYNTELSVEEKNVQNNFPDYQKTPTIQPSDLQPGIKINGPISALYEQFSKEGKSRRKLEELQEEDAKQEKISKRFNEENIGYLTGFKGDTLKDFMKFCRFGTNFIINAPEYDFLLAVKKRKEQYKQIRK
ncbi:MAG: carboxypeptidase-like regulatory domain-containing protein [Bacteroidales bacterium]|nr:carboxypeptidase-like regulatory domain-containing protein [Bacteroidales bacterium]